MSSMTDLDKNEGITYESNLSYCTQWVANSLSWSNQNDTSVRLAISSFIQDSRNFVDIVEKDDHSGQLVCRTSWENCYPPTKVKFPPRRLDTDVIITTADYLRLWQITETGSAPEDLSARTTTVHNNNGAAGNAISSTCANISLLDKKASTINSTASLRRVYDNGKPNDFCSPVTSCDWNSEDINMVACCSIDTTVTIWDLERNQHCTKLVAHDKDVYDIAFATAHTFASCGGDGSVRLFDLRAMDHCTILYETPGLSPLLRVAWNQQDQNYISTFGIESPDAAVIDVRYPSFTASLLSDRHELPINGMAWSPQSAQNICTVGEDGLVCIWGANADVGESLFQYTCGVPINNVAWRQVQRQDWIAITSSEGAKLLRL